MLVGIVGTRCSGKTSVCTTLGENGFATHSLSDILREKASERGVEPTREILYSIANEIRTKFGPAALMDEALNRIKDKDADHVIDTIRNCEEIHRLKLEKDAFVIGVDAEFDLRYERARERQKTTGKQEWAASREQFATHDAAEDTEDPNRPCLHGVLDHADVLLQNTRDDAENKRQVLAAIEHFRKSAPSADEDV